MVRSLLSIAVGLAGIACLAAPPETPQTAPNSAPAALDLVHQLERFAAGKPIPVAAVDESEAFRQPKPVPNTAAGPLVDGLRDVADAFSDPVRDLPLPLRQDAEKRRTVFQPYGFKSATGTVWTIAADRRMEPGSPQEPSDKLSELPDFELSGIFFRSLTKAQLQTATMAGLRWTDLTDVQQPMLKVLLARPYAVSRNRDPKGDDDGIDYVASSTEPLPVEKTVLHVYVGFSTLEVAVDPATMRQPAFTFQDEPPTEDYDLKPGEMKLRLSRRQVSWLPDYGATYDPKMKPSDLALDGPALAAAIGLRGVMPLSKIVAAAAEIAKMPLAVDARIGGRDAFVGSAAMGCGDVLELLTYSFDGAWRKVGDTYLLTWDRKGSAAPGDDDASNAAFMAEDKRAQQLRKQTQTPDWELTAERILQPPPDCPIGPTPEQWKALSAPVADDDSVSGETWHKIYSRPDTVFQFSRLDGAQQATIRNAFANRRTSMDSVPPNAPFSDDIFEKSYLDRPKLQVYLDIPGVGRVDATRSLYPIGGLEPWTAAYNDAEKRSLVRLAAAKLIHLAVVPTLTQPVRAVAPAPLPLSGWIRLFDQMKRKGLNTVYVPVLWGGQTLYPSDHFPMLPVCRGEDLLASVLATAKSRGIKIVAVLHTLAWRSPDSATHWLAHRADLLDVDAAGRTRREWADAHPLTAQTLADAAYDGRPARSGAAMRNTDPLLASDYVRPDLREVHARLLGVVNELRRYKLLDGVALAHWSRTDAVAPALGYGVAERVAFLREHGADPVDVSYGDSFDPKTYELIPSKLYKLWREQNTGEDTDLVLALHNEIEAAWPGRFELFMDPSPNSSAAAPRADVTVMPSAEVANGPAFYTRISPPFVVPPEVRVDDDGMRLEAPEVNPEQARARRLDAFHLALNGYRESDGDGSDASTFVNLDKAAGIVLDFTGSPDLLWDGLSLLANR